MAKNKYGAEWLNAISQGQETTQAKASEQAFQVDRALARFLDVDVDTSDKSTASGEPNNLAVGDKVEYTDSGNVDREGFVTAVHLSARVAQIERVEALADGFRKTGHIDTVALFVVKPLEEFSPVHERVAKALSQWGL